jgi:phosphoenolpyruvate carboxykinase (GTP)
MASEQTAAAEGPVGKLRRDPFAMTPFAGYNMADYWGHWLSMADRVEPSKLPKIFQVNWFKKDSSGNFIWPGFGENSRVIAWAIGRLEGTFQGRTSALGIMPELEELELAGLELSSESLEKLFEVDKSSWLSETEMISEFFAEFEDRLPKQMAAELEQLEQRIQAEIR